MRNILFIIHSLSTGGAERVTANLANYWAKKGWNVSIVTTSGASKDFYQLAPEVQRIALDLAGDSNGGIAAIVNNIQRIYALRKTLKKIRPDIAISMMATSNILLAISSIGLACKACIGSERTYPPQLPLGTVWEKMRTYWYGRLASVVALTNESSKWLHQHTHVKKVVVIPNAALWPLPIQAPILPVPSHRLAQRHILLAVGRLSEEKRFDLLITSFKPLAERHRDWCLIILGEGPKREELEQRILAQGLSNQVSLPGRAGNIGEWYSAADLYILTSRFEGFPNTLAEAMAHGLPAVSFDCDTGPRDIIRHGIDGLLVESGNIPALQSALGHLMADENLRRQFSLKAEEVRDRFSMEAVTSKWENLFAEVVK